MYPLSMVFTSKTCYSVRILRLVGLPCGTLSLCVLSLSLQRYLIPQARTGAGVGEEQLAISSDAINSLIKWYCRESGVRNLQKQIEKVKERVALKFRTFSKQVGGRKCNKPC